MPPLDRVGAMVAQARRPRLKAPTGWFGGKQHLTPWLIKLMPEHGTYVEVFGGQASLLWAKKPSGLEVYNDMDSGLVTFFRVLRDKRCASELMRLLDLTPYSREEWSECRAWRVGADEIEKARRWFVAVSQSFGGNPVSGAWGYTIKPGGNPAQRFRSRLAALSQFSARLAHVEIEHDDFAAILRRYDTPGTLFYCDPPYIPTSRQSGGMHYAHEMNVDDHTRFLSAACALKGIVMISGYPSDLYDAMLADWVCHRIPVMAKTQRHRGNHPARTECIWISPNATRRQLTLFD